MTPTYKPVAAVLAVLAANLLWASTLSTPAQATPTAVVTATGSGLTA